MSLLKPSNITGVDNQYFLHSKLEAVYEFGQLDKELISDTSITTTATTVTDTDLGECKEFTQDSDVLSEVLQYSGGEKTIVFVQKLDVSAIDGDTDVTYLDAGVPAGHYFTMALYNGTRHIMTFRGGNGSQIDLHASTASSIAEIEARRCLAISLSESSGLKWANDGQVDTSTSLTTSAYSTTVSAQIMSHIGSSVNSVRLAGILVFNELLTDDELYSVTTNPWGAVGKPAPRAVISVDTDNSVYAGQPNVSVNSDSVVANSTLRRVLVGGEEFAIEDWNSGKPIISIPLHSSLEMGVTHTVQVVDDIGSITAANGLFIDINPNWEAVTLGEIPESDEDSFYHEAGYTPSIGDILYKTANSGVTIDNAWRISAPSGSNISGDFKIWRPGTSDYTQVAQYSFIDGGSPQPRWSEFVSVTYSAGPDTVAPEINLIGSSVINIQQGNAFSDPGYTATDNIDGDITGNVVVGGDTVNTSTIGSYVITYNVVDGAGNSASEVSRTVNVSAAVDSIAPVITLNGNGSIDVEYGDVFTDPGATASDNIYGDISSDIVVAGDTVNVNSLGSYTITYDVSDAEGNAATQVTRVVNVVDTGAPVISLNGSSSVNIEVNDVFNDAGATANDAVDGDISNSIVVTGSVDTSNVGVYTLLYNVSDSSGNAAAQITRTVNVTSQSSNQSGRFITDPFDLLVDSDLDQPITTTFDFAEIWDGAPEEGGNRLDSIANLSVINGISDIVSENIQLNTPYLIILRDQGMVPNKYVRFIGRFL